MAVGVGVSDRGHGTGDFFVVEFILVLLLLSAHIKRFRVFRRPDWVQGYMYSLGCRGLRVSNSPVSS